MMAVEAVDEMGVVDADFDAVVLLQCEDHVQGRGLVRVTQDCTTPSRDLAVAIDADAARSPTAVKPAGGTCDTSPIVLEASAPGYAAVSISVPVSVDVAKDGVLAVAKATASNFADGFSYLDEFVG